jgi:hypothetical protein
MPTNNFKVGEMLNKRSLNSKTWINFDGSYTTEIHQGQIHFEDYEGNLHNIDTNLFDEADLFDYDGPIEKHGKDLLNEARERARADKKASKMNRDTYDFQGLKVPFLAKLPRNFKRGYKIGHGDNKLHFKPVGASPSKGYVDEERGNCIHYQDAWNDADVCLELTDKGIKETIVLKTDRAPYKFSFEVLGTLEDDLTAGTMALQPAWLEDAEGTKRDVTQTIRRVGEQTFIDLEADVVGLVYPIYIDPTVTIQPNGTAGKDAFVYSGTPDSTNDVTNITIGRDSSGLNRGLIQFDLSTIPVSSVITNATITFYVPNSFDGVARTVNIHRITNTWTENTVTWNTQPTFDATIAGTILVTTTGQTPITTDLSTLFSGWVNSSYTNYGLLMKMNDESTANTYKQFSSSDHATVGNRPSLSVTYNVPPTTPTVTAPNGGETLNSSYNITWTGATDTTVVETAPNETVSVSGLTSYATIGQTYKVKNTGVITDVSFYVMPNNASFSMTLDIKNSTDGQTPGTTTYATKSASVPVNMLFNKVTFTLTTPLSVTQNQLLFFKISGIPSDSVSLYCSGSSVYVDGNAYWNSVQTRDFRVDVSEQASSYLQYHIQLSTDNGTNWKDIIALTSAGATSYTYDFINEAQTSTGLIRIRAYDGSAYGPYDQSNGVFTIQHNQAPTAPTNLSPSGTVIDRAQIQRISWQHNDPNADTQSKFDLQWRLQGGSWTTVTQTTVNQYYDAPALTFPAGTIEYQVRTYDQAGLSGPYSAITTFTSADKPTTPTITSPTNGATVAVANPVVQWSAPTQSDYWVKITDSTGNTTIFEEIKTSGNKATTVTTNLSNSTSYKVKVAIKTVSSGLWSDFASNDITVSYTPPAIPTLTSIEDNIRGSIAITINNPTPTGTQPTVTSCDLYRQEGTGAFVCIKKGINGSYTDYTVKPNTTISYYVIANGNNGTVSQSATITDSAGVSLTQLALLSDNTKYVTLTLGTKLNESRKVERALMQFAGRKYAVAEFGEQKENGYSYSYVIKTQAELDTLESILDAQETILLRDTKGRKAFVTLEGISINELATYWEITLNPTQVEYNEGV